MSRMPIKSIKARQIFDSRGNPTVEVDLVCIYYHFKYYFNKIMNLRAEQCFCEYIVPLIYFEVLIRIFFVKCSNAIFIFYWVNWVVLTYHIQFALYFESSLQRLQHFIIICNYQIHFATHLAGKNSN